MIINNPNYNIVESDNLRLINPPRKKPNGIIVKRTIAYIVIELIEPVNAYKYTLTKTADMVAAMKYVALTITNNFSFLLIIYLTLK